jgi:hypothetical protein
MKMTLNDCTLIDLPKIADPRGNLTFIEGLNHVPFRIERVFYLYDVPGGAERGGHALRTCEQFLVAMSGSFDVTLDDGTQKKRIQLNRSYYGLYIPPMIWREMDNFSSGAVCLALASTPYLPGDYYYEYDEFLSARSDSPDSGREGR